MSRSKKLFFGAARIAISFTLLALLFFVMRRQLKEVGGILLNINRLWLLPALLLMATAHFFIAVRLRMFLAAQNIIICMREAIGLALIGYFFNNFMPTAVGGDMVKAYYASKKTEGRLHSFTAVFMDRFIGMIALALIALVAFVVLSGEVRGKVILWPIWLFFLSAILFLPLLFNKAAIAKISKIKFLAWAEKLHSSVMAFRGKRILFSKGLLISILTQLCSFTLVYVFVRAMNEHVPFVKIALLTPIVWMISMAPSIGGLGVREGAFLLLFKPLIGAEKAFALGLLWLCPYILLSISGGFVYAFAKHGKREEYND